MSSVSYLTRQKDNRLKDIPVVVVTSSCLGADRTESIAAGASEYLEKPLGLDQFSKALEYVLQRFMPN